MHVIDQRLLVREWPVREPGEEYLLGRVVSVGTFPREEGVTPFLYVDVVYDSQYKRYRLPNDLDVINQLLEFLCGNLNRTYAGECVANVVWVHLTEHGHKLFLSHD